MALTPIPVGSGWPSQPVSTPYRVEICFEDDGGGGDLGINGQGVTGSGKLDLRTFFGTEFRSSILLEKFQPVLPAGDFPGLLTDRTFKNIEVAFLTIGGVPVTKQPSFVTNLLSGGTVPCIQISGPGIATTFRATIRLRHSLDQ